MTSPKVVKSRPANRELPDSGGGGSRYTGAQATGASVLPVFGPVKNGRSVAVVVENKGLVVADSRNQVVVA